MKIRFITEKVGPVVTNHPIYDRDGGQYVGLIRRKGGTWRLGFQGYHIGNFYTAEEAKKAAIAKAAES